LAAAAFPNGDAIGAVVEPLSAGACRITGVAADVASFNLRGSPPAVIYVPFRQMPNEAVQSSLVIVARTRSGLSPSELEYNRGALARIIREAAPTLPVKVTPFRSIIEDLTSADRFRATLMAAVSIAALFLAAAGAFGAAAAYVASRRRELTMRGILGATPARLVASVAMDGLRLAGLGLSIGWTAAYFTLSLWSSQLPDLPRTDAGALILISGVVGSLVLASTYLAGRRLTRLNLADMLRAQ
jgi:putative ABC transport system permease protein